MARLGDHVEEQRLALGDEGAAGRPLIGVSNDLGLHASTRQPSADLSRYQRVERDWFAYNPMRADVGSIGLADDDAKVGFTSPDYVVFSCRDSLDPRYLLAFLKSDWGLEAIVRNSSGAVRKRLYFTGLSKIDFAIPGLDEQRAVIDRLSKTTETLAAIRAANASANELAHLRQLILDEAVRGRLTASWRKAHPPTESASTLLARVATERARLAKEKKLRKTKPLPPLTDDEQPFTLPDGWAWCRINDLGVVIGGMTKNATKRAGHKVEMPYLRVANVYADRLDLREIKTIGVSEKELPKLLLEEDDLLVVEGNGSKDQVGRVARWNGSIDPCLHQNHLIKVRLGDPRMAPWVLWWCLSPDGRLLIEEQARTSTGLYNLSVGKVTNLPIPLPPLAEQAAIATRVASLLTTCDTLDREIARSAAHATAFLRAVLRQAFAPAADRCEDGTRGAASPASRSNGASKVDGSRASTPGASA